MKERAERRAREQQRLPGGNEPKLIGGPPRAAESANTGAEMVVAAEVLPEDLAALVDGLRTIRSTLRERPNDPSRLDQVKAAVTRYLRADGKVALVDEQGVPLQGEELSVAQQAIRISTRFTVGAGRVLVDLGKGCVDFVKAHPDEILQILRFALEIAAANARAGAEASALSRASRSTTVNIINNGIADIDIAIL